MFGGLRQGECWPDVFEMRLAASGRSVGSPVLFEEMKPETDEMILSGLSGPHPPGASGSARKYGCLSRREHPKLVHLSFSLRKSVSHRASIRSHLEQS